MYLPGMKISAKIATIPGINLLYRWAHNKFYFDELYDRVAVGLSKFIAIVCAIFDQHIVDGLVNLSAWTVRGVGNIAGQFDNQVVD